MDLEDMFLKMMSQEADQRVKGETLFTDNSINPRFLVSILHTIKKTTNEDKVKVLAAHKFKELVMRREVSSIPELEKKEIIQLLASLVLSSKWSIHVPLRQGFVYICRNTRVDLFPQLKKRLVLALNKDDTEVVHNILCLVNDLFKVFRNYNLDEMSSDNRDTCIDEFGASLLMVIEKLSVHPKYVEENILCCRIFYSLSFSNLGLNTKIWSCKFLDLISADYSDIPTKEQWIVSHLHAAVCDNLRLIMETNASAISDQELENSVNEVITLLKRAGDSVSPGTKRFVTSSLKFLISLPSTYVFKEEMLIPVCDNIVLPNMMLNQEDEELFINNYIEFIRREGQGSDLETRRRLSCKLFKRLYNNNIHFVVDKFTLGCTPILNKLDQSNWKHVELAICFVVSIAPDATGMNESFLSFFKSVVMKVLALEVDSFPLLRASALNCLTAFRNVIPDGVVLGSSPHLVKSLGSNKIVIQSMAAICIGNVILKQHVLSKTKQKEQTMELIVLKLFTALEMHDSIENTYIMWCIMRCFMIAHVPNMKLCIPKFEGVLQRHQIHETSSDLLFRRYLFESLAAYVGRTGENNSRNVVELQQWLVPFLASIIERKTSSFSYACELMAQLMDQHTSYVDAGPKDLWYCYTNILDQILAMAAEKWKESANVPGPVRLLQSFIQCKDPDPLSIQRLESVLLIFTQLISSPSTEEHGVHILRKIVESDSLIHISFMSKFWDTLVKQLKVSVTPTLAVCFIISMSTLLVKRGSPRLKEWASLMELNIDDIMKVIWIPHLKNISSITEIKLTAVASTHLLSQPFLLDDKYDDLWGELLDSIIALVPQLDKPTVEDDMVVCEFGLATGVCLHNIRKRDEQQLKALENPKQELVAILGSLSLKYPGRFPPIISKYVSEDNQYAISRLFETYGQKIQ